MNQQYKMSLLICSSVFLIAFIFEGIGISSIVVYAFSNPVSDKCEFNIQMFLLIYGHISAAMGIFWIALGIVLIYRSGNIIDSIYVSVTISSFLLITMLYLIFGITLSGGAYFSGCSLFSFSSAMLLAIFVVYTLVFIVFISSLILLIIKISGSYTVVIDNQAQVSNPHDEIPNF